MDVSTFLNSSAIVWKGWEVRATHRRQARWRTRQDPFERAWGVVEGWSITYGSDSELTKVLTRPVSPVHG
jgi:hypothetical protein